MIGFELVKQVDALRNALNRNEYNAVGRIFALYKSVLGKRPRVSGCLNCAIEALVELKQFGKENLSVNLPQPLKKQIEPVMLTKYNIPKPFMPFGSPKVYMNTNTTDEELEELLNVNPKLAGHVEVLSASISLEAKVEEAKSEQPTEQTEQPAPKKRGRKAK